ncbi:hypothetical protein AAHH17_02645 [Lysinibacillus capsici]|uniref:hypothetical protein n=1 Tax=Lysinibacillus capsici TaxID=2115968 RepID=UPI0032E4738A
MNYVDGPIGNGEFHISFYSDEELGIRYEVKIKAHNNLTGVSQILKEKYGLKVQ